MLQKRRFDSGEYTGARHLQRSLVNKFREHGVCNGLQALLFYLPCCRPNG